MIRRQHGGLIASLLAFSLMACTDGPLTAGLGPDGRPSGLQPSPTLPSPSPFKELEVISPQDEEVEPAIAGLKWRMEDHNSPRDQQVQRIHGARGSAEGYRLFLQQGDRFYFRRPDQNAQGATQWFDTQVLPSHRGYFPTRLFSDGTTLFFVNDPIEALFSGEERVYQAKEGDSAWKDSGLPKGIVAVAGGPEVAFAATSQYLYRWNGSNWQNILDLTNAIQGDRIVSMTLDSDNGSNDLMVVVRCTDGTPYRLKALLAADPTKLVDTQQIVTLGNIDSPVKVYRSYKDTTPNSLGLYNYWGISVTSRIYSSIGNLVLYTRQPAFIQPFKGLTKLKGRFYAYRGSEIYHLLDTSVSSLWEPLASVKTDGSALTVSLSDEHHLSTDGNRLYAAGPEGLFSLPLLNGTPSGAWAQESVELNRASVSRVVKAGTQLYAQTTFGTYTLKDGKWVPFVLGDTKKRPALAFTSIYGQAATVAYKEGNDPEVVEIYVFKQGSWRKIERPLPNGARPVATKVFFSKDRLFVVGAVLNGEAIFQRALSAPETQDWSPAAPEQGISAVYPDYVCDGRNLFAVGINRVMLASLAEQRWKEYTPKQVLPDGSSTNLLGARYESPFAVFGYAFTWVQVGDEWRLCRATSKGWKAMVNNRVDGLEVGRQLSTDGTYLYSTTTENGLTKEIVRVAIKDGSAWEKLGATIPAQVKANVPPLVDRESAQVYLGTTRGILWGQ